MPRLLASGVTSRTHSGRVLMLTVRVSSAGEGGEENIQRRGKELIKCYAYREQFNYSILIYYNRGMYYKLFLVTFYRWLMDHS